MHLRQICQTVHRQLLCIALASRSQAFDVARNSKSRIRKPGGIKWSRRGVGTQYSINDVFHGELRNKCTAITAVQHSGAAGSIPFLGCRLCRGALLGPPHRSEPGMRLPNLARRKRKPRSKIRFPLSLRCWRPGSRVAMLPKEGRDNGRLINLAMAWRRPLFYTGTGAGTSVVINRFTATAWTCDVLFVSLWRFVIRNDALRDQNSPTFALRSEIPCAKRLILLVWKGGRVV